MADVLLVEPAVLRAAVTSVTAATDALAAARAGLDAVRSWTAPTLTDTAEHKVGTFVRQWREECAEIGDHLDAYQRILVEIALVYGQFDSELAACLSGPGS